MNGSVVPRRPGLLFPIPGRKVERVLARQRGGDEGHASLLGDLANASVQGIVATGSRRGCRVIRLGVAGDAAEATIPRKRRAEVAPARSGLSPGSDRDIVPTGGVSRGYPGCKASVPTLPRDLEARGCLRLLACLMAWRRLASFLLPGLREAIVRPGP